MTCYTALAEDRQGSEFTAASGLEVEITTPRLQISAQRRVYTSTAPTLRLDATPLRVGISTPPLRIAATSDVTSSPKDGSGREVVITTPPLVLFGSATEPEREECRPGIAISVALRESTRFTKQDVQPGCPDYSIVGDFANTKTMLVFKALEIESGVRVHVARDIGIRVLPKATLSISGEPGNPVVLSGALQEVGFWRGIEIASNVNGSMIQNSIIEYAGSSDMTSSNYDAPANITITGSGVVGIRDTVLRHSAGYGLFASYKSQLPNFQRNTLTTNALSPVYIDGPAAHFLLPSSTYQGNSVDKVLVNARYGRIKGQVTWKSIGVPFRLVSRLPRQTFVVSGNGNSLTVLPGASVELSPGISVKAGPGASISGIPQ
ncbi:MAG: hypothetical protein AAFQ16_05765 [Pseudomonadota bacterium]